MVVPLPTEPIKVTRPGNVILALWFDQMFNDDIARSLWLLLMPVNLGNVNFERWCFNISQVIKSRGWDKEPNLEGFHYWIHYHPPYEAKFSHPPLLSVDFEESKNWLERFSRAVSGEEPVKYDLKKT